MIEMIVVLFLLLAGPFIAVVGAFVIIFTIIIWIINIIGFMFNSKSFKKQNSYIEQEVKKALKEKSKEELRYPYVR